MTDRELLELAAKAAGYNAFLGHAEQMMDSGWNPLEDDGDALRLAVSLGIIVHPDRHEERSIAEWGDADQAVETWHGIRNQGADAATRRAIVRAAAEIGRVKT